MMKNVLKSSYKIGLVGCEDLPKWGREEGFFKLLKDIFAVDSLFANGLGLSKQVVEEKILPNIEWVPVHAISGELPDESELHSYDGFIMSGSHYSVNDDNQQWIIRLQDWIRKVKHFQDNNIDPPRIIAICFSHQLVNKALGGSVGPNPSTKFVWKLEDVDVNNSVEKHTFFLHPTLGGKSNFKLLQSHGECVLSVPEEGKTLASSPTSEHEIVAIGEHIITMQAHPEMLVEQMTGLILPSLKSKQLISEEEANLGIKSFQNETDGNHMLSMIMSFIAKYPI
eukprot:gene7891-8745_t